MASSTNHESENDKNIRKNMRDNMDDVIEYIADPYVLMHSLKLDTKDIQKIKDATDSDRQKGLNTLLTIIKEKVSMPLLMEVIKNKRLRLLEKTLKGEMNSMLKEKLKKEKLVLKNCLDSLVDKVDNNDILDFLKSKEALVTEDFQKIKDDKSRGSSELFLRISTRHEDWFQILLAALESQKTYSHVIQELKDTLEDGLMDTDDQLVPDGVDVNNGLSEEAATKLAIKMSLCSVSPDNNTDSSNSLEARIIKLLKDQGKPMTAIQIARALGYKRKGDVNSTLYKMKEVRQLSDKDGGTSRPSFELVNE